MLVTWSGRLFSPRRFPLTHQVSVKSNLLQEAFPVSPSFLHLFFQGVYVLGHQWLIMGLSSSLGCELPEGRASAIPVSILSTQYHV